MLTATGTGLLALVLAAHVVRGGVFLRRLSLVALGVAALAAIPWARAALTSESDPLLVVRAPSVALRSEPRRELSPIARVDAGERVERIDALPGWVRVRNAEGDRGWVPVTSVQRVYTRP